MVKDGAKSTANLLSCSLDDLVKKDKQGKKGGWKKGGWKKGGWKKGGNWKKGGWKKGGNWKKGGWKKGNWKKGGWKNRKGRGRYGGWSAGKSLSADATPLEKLQMLAQNHSLMPTIAVLKQTDKGMQISIEMDVSAFEDKPAGSVVLRQLAWGTDIEAAKTTAVLELLKHESLADKVKAAATPLFPKKGEGEGDSNEKSEDGTWISKSCFFNHPNLALMLFERYMTERGSLVTYNESGEFPKCKVECVIDGTVRGTGTSKGMWTAKKFAIKEAYYWCKTQDKEGSSTKEGETETK